MLTLLYEMEPGQYFHSLNLKFIKYYHCDIAHEIIPVMFAVSKQNAVGANLRSRLVPTGAHGRRWLVGAESLSIARPAGLLRVVLWRKSTKAGPGPGISPAGRGAPGLCPRGIERQPGEA